jgi:hypothetical protein
MPSALSPVTAEAAFGEKRASTGRPYRLDRSKMTQQRRGRLKIAALQLTFELYFRDSETLL